MIREQKIDKLINYSEAVKNLKWQFTAPKKGIYLVQIGEKMVKVIKQNNDAKELKQ